MKTALKTLWEACYSGRNPDHFDEWQSSIRKASDEEVLDKQAVSGDDKYTCGLSNKWFWGAGQTLMRPKFLRLEKALIWSASEKAIMADPEPTYFCFKVIL